jgi:hypothetical protein
MMTSGRHVAPEEAEGGKDRTHDGRGRERLKARGGENGGAMTGPAMGREHSAVGGGGCRDWTEALPMRDG